MTMYDYAGRFAWGPVTGVEQMTFTRSRGIQPSTCQFVVRNSGRLPTGSSNMSFSDGRNGFIMKDCILSDIRYDPSDGPRWIITLLDYRWKWAFGRIAGRYNVTRANEIIPRTKKTPAQLAELCFKEMGVTRFDTSQMPRDVFPPVDWNNAVPARALEDICSQVGCVVCPMLNGAVRICVQGEGNQLPDIRGGDVTAALDLSESPDAVLMHADATAYEISIRVTSRALALEKDGQIVLADDVSYKPRGGWSKVNPETMSDVDEEYIRLAQQSMFKYFSFKFPIKAKGLPFDITSVDQILPILDYRMTMGEVVEEVSGTDFLRGSRKEKRRKSPLMYGRFFDYKDLGKNNVARFSHEYDKNKKLIYDGGWNIDQDRGIIIFDDPVFVYGPPGEPREGYPGNVSPPESDKNKSLWVARAPVLYLRVAVNISDLKTGYPMHHTLLMQTGRRNGTKPHSVVEASCRRVVICSPSGGDVIYDNKTEIEATLRSFGSKEIKKFVPVATGEGKYNGFQPIELDGAIAQVTYEIDGEGYAMTTASRNQEHSLEVPTFKARQRLAAFQEFLNRQRIIEKSAPNKEGVK